MTIKFYQNPFGKLLYVGKSALIKLLSSFKLDFFKSCSNISKNILILVQSLFWIKTI